MKNHLHNPTGYKYCISLLFFLTTISFLQSQNVDVTATGGTAFTSYSTLKDAFDAINAGTHTGDITVDIVSNTTETATCGLNGSGTGAASYSSVLIQPAGGASREISGAIAGGNPLVSFDGADYVTMNGLNADGNALTITNTTISSIAGTSTIRFQNDATNNIITNCTVLGSSTVSLFSAGGTIYIGKGATVSGNNDITISYCNIGPVGTNFPSKAIYCTGTSNTYRNLNTVIDHCNIYDYFHPSASNAGVVIDSYTGGLITISNNKLYQTSTKTSTSSATHYGIYTNPSTLFATVTISVSITGNTIGYASSDGTGTYTLNGNVNHYFYGIYAYISCTVEGNIINNISFSTSAPSSTFSSGPCEMILAFGTIDNNQIGSLTVPGSILFNSTNTSSTHISGIYCLNGMTTCSNNTIGGITASSNNCIVNGIYELGGGSSGIPLNVNNNIIANNIVSGTTNASNYGLYLAPSSPIMELNVYNNKIYNLENTSSSTGIVYGMYFLAGCKLNVYNNFIGDLRTPSVSNADAIIGIDMNYYSFTNYDATIAYNTIYLSAASAGGTFGTSGIRHAPASNIDLFLNNNIIINKSTPNGSGLTVALNRKPITSTTLLTYYAPSSNNNLFYAGTPGPSNLIYYDGTNAFQTLPDFISYASEGGLYTREQNSITHDQLFLSLDGASPDFLHIDVSETTPCESGGINISGIETDYDGDIRQGNTGYSGSGTAPDIGGDEFESIACTMLTWYADIDGDTYGDEAVTTLACTAPSGYVSDNTDCDDSDGSINPAASEICNGVDDNCDGNIDEGVLITFYADVDGDLFGDASSTTLACSAPLGYVSDNTDCDDSNGSINPGATEVCNGVDDNCDGNIDEGVLITFYADVDGDLFGDASSTTLACSAPLGYVSDNTDCDDSDGSINPAATEICNGVDDNCDGNIDEGVLITFYADVDGDSFGDASSTSLACSAPSGYVSDNTDCDDTNGAINPGATEVCNGVDDNCNGNIDEGVLITFYADVDGDLFGDASSTTLACSAPSGYVSNNTDCDDTNASINPAATEICNELDDNCDGSIDEGVQATYYADTDLDTYGDASSTTLACSAPTGYVSNNTDCDDTNASINPAATEVCNGVDDNCDGNIDEGVLITFYADVDGDLFGDASSTTLACSAPSGYVSDNTDCDDTNASINPGATEICNGIDDDCDGSIDEDVITAVITPSGATTFCKGGSVVLNANSGTGYTYQWTRNGVNISGATGSSITVNKTGEYRVIITAPGGCSSTSEATTVVVNTKPNAIINNLDGTTNLCVDYIIKLKANGGSGYTYQWYKGGTAISGATNQVYLVTTVGNYKVKVTNSSGCSKVSSSLTIVNDCRIEEAKTSDDISIYPNPGSGIFTIQANIADKTIQDVSIELYDATGAMIASMSEEITDGTLLTKFDASEFAAGVYFVRINYGNASLLEMLVLQK